METKGYIVVLTTTVGDGVGRGKGGCCIRRGVGACFVNLHCVLNVLEAKVLIFDGGLANCLLSVSVLLDILST